MTFHKLLKNEKEIIKIVDFLIKKNTREFRNPINKYENHTWIAFITYYIYSKTLNYFLNFKTHDSKENANKSNLHIPGYFYIWETVEKRIKQLKLTNLIKQE